MSNRARRDTVVVPMPGPDLVWITRDSDASGPFPNVSVWSMRPDRYTDEMGAYWVADKDDDRLAIVELGVARMRYRTLPDNDMECIRLYTMERHRQ